MVPEEENDGLLDAERHQARHTIAPRAQLFPVAEKFVSVNGEGLAAGRPAAFIRFAGCNMWCTYCDTRWANHPLVEVEGWSVPDLVAWVAETGVSCVTLTGGEPLLQPYLPDLVQTLLAVDDPRPLRVEIETNGSRDLSPMAHLREACVEAGLPGSLHFTVDWKTPTAGEAVSAAMRRENYDLLDTRDAVKFVVGTENDLAFMECCADEAGLWDRCAVLVSPVWGAIEPAEIAAYLIDHGLDRARLQLQLHTIIWPDARGLRIWKERTMTKTKALVLCSGGVDSTTLLARAVSKYGAENVYALSISYGQKHVREIEAARTVAAYYGVQQRFLDLGAIFADSDCSLLDHSDAAVPQSSYAEQQAAGDGGPVSTYVPFRNGLFLSSAASMALSLGCSVVYYGAHHDDWAGNAYPDCSLEFVEAMNRAIVEGTGGELRLEAPFVTWSKADIVREGLALGVPYELTWSCYEGGEAPCGRCATCLDRAAAFAANGVEDPALG